MKEDRSSNIDFHDCGDCSGDVGSGICANCDADGMFCPPHPPGCGGNGKCCYCDGTGRQRIEVNQALLAEVRAAGPLVVPHEDHG